MAFCHKASEPGTQPWSPTRASPSARGVWIEQSAVRPWSLRRGRGSPARNNTHVDCFGKHAYQADTRRSRSAPPLETRRLGTAPP